MYACFSAAVFSAQTVFPTVAVTWCDSAGCCGWPWRWQRQKPRQGLLSLAAALAGVAGAAANNLAGQLAHQIWQILQGSTAPPGMLSGPSASEAAAPSVGAPGHSAPTHGASSSAPGPLPAATNPPGPTEESEEPPWRRSRSRLPPAAASAEPPAPPPLVSAPPAGPGSAAAVPTPATAVVDVEREPGESRPAVRLDLRACRVCGAQAYQGKSICLNMECVSRRNICLVWGGVFVE